mgnify:CR=1 FL=1|jgi:hypothetical protein
MKSITINGSKRESVGKVATKALRNAMLKKTTSSLIKKTSKGGFYTEGET